MSAPLQPTALPTTSPAKAMPLNSLSVALSIWLAISFAIVRNTMS